jgi:transcriptional regulator with XRE-family HTH domain
MEMKIDRALVKQLRLEKSWSQELLADESGLNLRTIQRIESRGVASLQTRRAVARALGIEPAALEFRLELEPQDGAADATPRMDRRGTEPAAAAGPRRARVDKGMLLIGLYAFAAALSFGFVILDQIYAYLIENQIAASDSAFVFSEVADFLLQFSLLVTLVACIALAAAWAYPRVRNLLLASILIGSLAPILLVWLINVFLPGVWGALESSNTGALLRFSLYGLASGFASWAWLAYSRDRRQV